MEQSEEMRVSDKCSGWIDVYCLPPWRFADLEEEKLYLEYTQRLRQVAVLRLLATGMLFQLFTALVPGEREIHIAFGSAFIFLAVNSFLSLIYIIFDRARSTLKHVAWFVLWAHLIWSSSRRLGDSYNELLGWAVVLQYFTIATMPLHYMLLIFYSALSFTAYLLVQYYNASTAESRLADDFHLQVNVKVTIFIMTTMYLLILEMILQ